MSISSEFFEAPPRVSDYQAEREKIHPDFPLSEERAEELWTPTDDELGQHRYACITPIGQESYLGRGTFLDIERLASSGMRQIFGRFGLNSFHQTEQNATAYGKPVVVEHAAITFPSSHNLRERARAFANETGTKSDKLTITPVPPKRFSGLQQIGELAQGKLVMSVESADDTLDGVYYLSYFSHDERIHFPGWLCLPGSITTAICREAGVAMSNYNYAIETSDWMKRKTARARISEMTGLIDDLVTAWTMTGLVAGNADSYGDKMSELLRWPAPRIYRDKTLKHIEKPAPDEVLVAKWR